MTKKEIFYAYTQNKLHTREAYLVAYDYYLKEATETEKRQFDLIMNIITNVLEQNYAKSASHFNIIVKRFGLTNEEGLDLIRKKRENSPEEYLEKIQNRGESKEAFLQRLYQQCEALRWNKKALEKLAQDYYITYELLWKLIMVYIKDILHSNRNKTDSIARRITGSTIFDEFVTQGTISNYRELKWYVQKWGSEKEQEAYYNAIEKIISAFQEEKISINGMANRIHHSYQIAVADAKEMIMIHMQRIKKKASIDQKDKRYQELYKMLLENNSLNEIEAYLNEYNLSLDEFTTNYLPTYLKRISNQKERKETEKKILTKAQGNLKEERNSRRRLRDRLKKEKIEENEILSAKRVVTDLIHNDNSVKSLTAMIGIERFYRIITIVELHDPELYGLYYAKTNRGEFNISIDTLQNLAVWISNGVEENGAKREFTILDYFEIIRIPLSSIPKVLTGLSEKEKYIILHFILQKKPTLKSLSSEYRKDLATPTEEERVIRYLIGNNIPLYEETYYLALLKYRSGLLKEENSRN